MPTCKNCHAHFSWERPPGRAGAPKQHCSKRCRDAYWRKPPVPRPMGRPRDPLYGRDLELERLFDLAYDLTGHHRPHPLRDRLWESYERTGRLTDRQRAQLLEVTSTARGELEGVLRLPDG